MKTIETPLIGIIPAILYPILLAAKQGITAPRLRPGDLSAAQGAQRRTVTFIVLGLALLLGFLFFVLVAGTPATRLSSWLVRYLPTALWLLVIGIFAVWSYRSGERRFMSYAVLFLVASVVSFWFDLPLYFYALVLGALICVSGLAVTINFVQAHPKVSQG